VILLDGGYKQALYCQPDKIALTVQQEVSILKGYVERKPEDQRLAGRLGDVSCPAGCLPLQAKAALTRARRGTDHRGEMLFEKFVERARLMGLSTTLADFERHGIPKSVFL
jgi:hypothetical protein